MTLKERYDAVLEWFEAHEKAPRSELAFSNPFQLIVSVVLSAQCTDKRVNMVTPALFDRYPGPRQMAAAPVEDILEMISSVSYPNSKAAHLKGLAQKLVSDFGGKVPDSIEELMTLPGVGRKTANVVASILYDEPVIAVDTHVYRVSHRLGLSKGKTPYDVEKDLERHIPEAVRASSHHYLLLHGRYVCTARAPKCAACELKGCCKYFEDNA